MELMLDLKKGKDTSTVWVNNKDVARSKNEKTEQREFVGKGDPNEVAIKWAGELVGQGWRLDWLRIIDMKPGDLASVLERLPRPSKLHLRAKKLSTVHEVAALPEVTALQLGGVTKDTDLTTLSSLPRLSSLDILAADDTCLLAAVPELPVLRELETNSLGIEAAALRRFPALESLTISSTSLTDLSFLSAAALPVRKLSLRWLASKALSLAPVVALAPKLESLEIWLRDVAVSDVEVIGQCKELTSLGLKGVQVPLELLGTLSKLRSLDVAITPSSLAPLASLHALESLALSLPEKKKLPKGAVSALVGNERLRITYEDRTWSAAHLDGYLAGTFKLPTLKDAARPAHAIKTRTLKKGASAPAHFGGGARLAKGEQWPRCNNCKRPMPLFVELDLAQIKRPKKKLSGLLQFFYCNSDEPLCEVECKSWDLNDRAMLLRVIPSNGKTAAVECPPDVPSPVPARSIELGPEKADFPDGQDAGDRYGIHDAPDRTLAGDKLLGWPYWVQGNEWPSCPDCAKPMDILLQMQSDKGIAHQWGDSGHAYLFLCFDHPTRVGFVWQGC